MASGKGLIKHKVKILKANHNDWHYPLIGEESHIVYVDNTKNKPHYYLSENQAIKLRNRGFKGTYHPMLIPKTDCELITMSKPYQKIIA